MGTSLAAAGGRHGRLPQEATVACAVSPDGGPGGVSSVDANAVSFHLLGFWEITISLRLYQGLWGARCRRMTISACTHSEVCIPSICRDMQRGSLFIRTTASF